VQIYAGVIIFMRVSEILEMQLKLHPLIIKLSLLLLSCTMT